MSESQRKRVKILKEGDELKNLRSFRDRMLRLSKELIAIGEPTMSFKIKHALKLSGVIAQEAGHATPIR